MEDAAECPVCGLSISLKRANRHIDECLQGKDPDSDLARNSAGKVGGPSDGNLGLERKRQSLLNFGAQHSSPSRKQKKIKIDPTELKTV